MVELVPNSCRICLTITQTNERQLLYSDEGHLSDVGLLFEEVLNLPIDCDGKILKNICNSCELQLKLFKELKSKALETHLLLSNIFYDLTDECLIENCTVTDQNKIEVIEHIEEDEYKDYLASVEEIPIHIEDNEDDFPEIEEIQYLDEEELLDDIEFHKEEHLIEPKDIKIECMSPNNGQSEVFKCFDCDETFRLKTHLINHKRKVHPKTKRFSCHLCPKTMYSEEALEVHLNLHNGLPAYQCEICDKTFKQKTHHTYHMLNHRNERNIICDICQKGFISKSDLRIHNRVHTDERRYKCDVCAKTFRANTHMINHRYSHFEKQFECPACFQKYISPNTLRTHFKAVHMGEVPHECEFCEKKFKRKHHLRAHYKTHKLIEVSTVAMKQNRF